MAQKVGRRCSRRGWRRCPVYVVALRRRWRPAPRQGVRFGPGGTASPAGPHAYSKPASSSSEPDPLRGAAARLPFCLLLLPPPLASRRLPPAEDCADRDAVAPSASLSPVRWGVAWAAPGERSDAGGPPAHAEAGAAVGAFPAAAGSGFCCPFVEGMDGLGTESCRYARANVDCRAGRRPARSDVAGRRPSARKINKGETQIRRERGSFARRPAPLRRRPRPSAAPLLGFLRVGRS